MSNAFIRLEALPAGRIWLQLAGSVAALATVASQLPGPLSAVGVMTGGRRISGAATLDAAALSAASLLVWGLLGWAVCTTLLAAVARVPGRTGMAAAAVLRRVAPTAMRRALIAGVGISLLAGSTACGADRSAQVSAATHGAVPVGASTAHAAASTAPLGQGTAARGVPSPDRQATPQRSDPRTPQVELAQPDPGPAAGSIDLDWPVHRPGSEPKAPSVDLDWPTGTATRARTGSTQAGTGTGVRPAAARTAVVTVQSGDTLWALAEQQLQDAGGQVTDARIDAGWRLWYAANRSVIGDDPDLILPGQHLRPPPAGETHTQEAEPRTAPTNGETR